MKLKFALIFVILIATLGMTSLSIGLIAGNDSKSKSRLSVVKISNQDKFLSQREASFLVDRELDEVLHELPDAFSARLNLIQSNVIIGEDQSPLLRYDVVNSRQTPGIPGGELTKNLPLSQWTLLLDKAQAGECAFLIVSDLPINSTLRERFIRLGLTASMTCPLMIRDTMVGMLFTSFKVEDPQNIDVPKVIEVCKTAVIKITAYLEISVNENYQL